MESRFHPSAYDRAVAVRVYSATFGLAQFQTPRGPRVHGGKSQHSQRRTRSLFGESFYQKLNAQWHERALLGFMAIVLGHWGEHFAQALSDLRHGWPRPKANGILGLWYPWLIKSETLHYGYALVMLIGLWVLLKGFTGLSRKWWIVALVIQFWHHIEHFLLILQATIHHNFWGKPVPCSVLQLFFPRVELHLFYNSVVFIPMVIAMYYHMFPPVGERQQAMCTCSWRKSEDVA